MPDPTLARQARTLVARNRIGTLSTQSQKFPGYPFGSLMPYAADPLGRPILFISRLAMHTRNLQQDPHVSLLITHSDGSADPLSVARVTLLGTAQPAPREEVRDLYLTHHENARNWQDFSDFAFYRLDVMAAYFIAGFGVMGWISAQDYAAAGPDQ